ncbi:MAG: alpha/beta fold hydrolase [Desulfovibrio sp.]|nr:alpha/beta fold hydrolase [Desulfovibrio sp.]MBI4960233.1 alpha/beta fold hydrolase [Desulfovibrio sp.]
MKSPHLIFVHGWGFTPAFWDPLRSILSQYSSSALDLGFFGQEDASFPTIHTGTPCVAVGHSLGVPWLLRQTELRYQAFVSLGGFGRFDVSAGPIRAMRRGLGKNVQQVLTGFHQACGLPLELAPDVSQARPDRLAQGLDWLLTWDEAKTLEALPVPVLAIATQDDAIVPETLSRSSFPKDLIMLPGGGHAFPATRASECAGLITQFLEAH